MLDTNTANIPHLGVKRTPTNLKDRRNYTKRISVSRSTLLPDTIFLGSTNLWSSLKAMLGQPNLSSLLNREFFGGTPGDVKQHHNRVGGKRCMCSLAEQSLLL